MKPATREGLIASVTLAAAVTVFVPLQTYIGNTEIYPFSTIRLLPELFALFAVLTLGLLLVRWLFAFIRVNVVPVYMALVVIAYLETGLLSYGIPEINGGAVPMLASRGRALLDLGVWAAILVAFAVGSRWLKGAWTWISVSVCILMGASLLDVSRPSTTTAPAADADGIESGFEIQPTVVANVRYSPDRNILVFVLDSLPGTDAAALMRTNAALRAKFDGFTAYTENLGMHECTKFGVPGIVTGRHFDPAELAETDYPMTMYGSNSLVTAAVKADWKVAFSPDLLPYGYTNLPVEHRVARKVERRSRDVLAVLRQSTEVPCLSLFDLTAFRIVPFAFKGPLLYGRIRHAVKGRHGNDEFWQERSMYRTLAAAPEGPETRPFLGFFHSWGVHPPWEGTLASVIAGKLETLGDLMETYRKRGIYDRSLIVVTSDHGLDFAIPHAGFPPTASALLWVKPEGASAAFAESELKTTHAGIAALVKASLKGAVTDVAPSLRSDARLFRRTLPGTRGKYEDWRDR